MKQKLLKEYEESREPVTLLNVTLKRSLQDPSGNDIIVNKRTHIEEANNYDIPYEYDEILSFTEQHLIFNEDILSLQENRMTSVKETCDSFPRLYLTSSHEQWFLHPYTKSLSHY